MHISRRNILVGAILATASSALFTGKVIVAKLAYAHGIDPLGIISLRMVSASPFFAAMLLLRLRQGARVSPRDLGVALFLGILCYYVASMLDFGGVQYVSTALERMILQLSPSFVLFIGVLFMGEKLDLRLLASICVGYLGVALMVYSELGGAGSAPAHPLAWLGVLMIIGATLCFSIYVIGAERMMRRMDSRLFTSLSMIGACGGVFAHYVVQRGFVAPTHDPVVLGYGVAMGIFCTVLPSFMVNRAIQMMGGQRIGPYNYAGMGLTFVASSFLLNESFSVLKLAGILLACVGAMALTFGGARNKASK